jgi:hypothetical protein
MIQGLLRGIIIAMLVCAGPALLFLITALVCNICQYHLRGDSEFSNRE